MKNRKARSRSVLTFLLLAIIFLIFCLIPHPADTSETPQNTATIKPIIPQVMHDISWCESKDRQFNDDGTVYRGVINSEDVGKYQINEHYHLLAAQKMGIDIYTEDGNEQYAMVLYNAHGTRDWNASRSCWENIDAYKAKSQSYY